jgi:hypothetical protein
MRRPVRGDNAKLKLRLGFCIVFHSPHLETCFQQSRPYLSRSDLVSISAKDSVEYIRFSCHRLGCAPDVAHITCCESPVSLPRASIDMGSIRSSEAENGASYHRFRNCANATWKIAGTCCSLHLLNVGGLRITCNHNLVHPVTFCCRSCPRT